MLGLFSYVVDYMQLQAAEAASRQQLHPVRCTISSLHAPCTAD
jgi:hypothetical protein